MTVKNNRSRKLSITKFFISFHEINRLDDSRVIYDFFRAQITWDGIQIEFSVNFCLLFALKVIRWTFLEINNCRFTLTHSIINLDDRSEAWQLQLHTEQVNCARVARGNCNILGFEQNEQSSRVSGVVYTSRMNFSSVWNCVHKDFLIKLTWLPNLALSNTDLLLLTDKPHTRWCISNKPRQSPIPYFTFILRNTRRFFCKSESTNRESVNKVQPDVRRQASTSLCSEQRNMKSCNNLSHSFASAMRNGRWNCNFSYTLYVTSDKN